MEFQKERCFTSVDADELKVGSKVFVAKNLHALRDQVIMYNDTNNTRTLCTLIGIHSENYQDRFCAKFDTYGIEVTTTLAYLVSEPEEKKLKWTDLKIGDVITNGKITRMVVAVDSRGSGSHIYAGNSWMSNDYLKEWEKIEK